MTQVFTRRRLLQAGAGTAFVLGAAQAPKRVFANNGVNVVTTLGQIADPVANIVGESGTVTALMGAGTDPHLYKPTAGDISRLEEANIVLYGGLELEGRMGDTLAHLARQDKTVVAVSETVDTSRLIQEADEAWDPHLWFNVELWRDALSSIPDVLAEKDPDNEDLFQQNWEDYAQTLTELDEYVMEQSEQIPESQRVLVTAHDAFGYFGDRYGFEVHGIQGMSTATEASASDIQDLADFLTERNIPAIFVESSVSHSTIEALREATNSRGWKVSIGGELFSDAMGEDGTPEGTYEGMVRHNIDTIVAALS